MGHPDQNTPDDHRTSRREHAPKPEEEEGVTDDMDPSTREELEERADTGSSVRADEPEEGMAGEYGHGYMGRQMDDRLKKNPRPRNEDELKGGEE